MGRHLLTTLIVTLFTFTSAQAESGHGDTGSFEEPTEGFSSESVNTPTYEDFEAIDQVVVDLFQAYEYRARAKEQKLIAPERQELLDRAMEETEESVRPTVQTKVIIDFGQPKTEKKTLQAERREVEQQLSAAGLFPGNAPIPAAAKPVAVTPASVTAPNIVLNNAVNVAAAIFFLFSGKVIWPVALVMAIGALIGGALGGRLAGKIKPSTLRWTVVTIGVVISIIYFVRG